MYVYNAEAIRKIDEKAIEQGFSLFGLMENAGKGLFDQISTLLDEKMQIVILAGRGNNGGDGIVLARYLMERNFQVELIFPIGEPNTDVAKQHLSYYFKQGFSVTDWDASDSYDIVIDSLLGIGTKLPLRENLSNVIGWANQIDALKIAVDLPTGTLADYGETDFAFKADYTFALHGMKPAAYLLPSSEYYGIPQAVDIGLKQGGRIKVLNKEEIISSFPKRAQASHKGTFGTSLLVAGSDEMPGSALLASIGAVRSGVGKLAVATTSSVTQIIASRVPEATYVFDGLERIAEGKFDKKIASAGIGPGISNQVLSSKALTELIKCDIPVVIDAGALDPSLDFKRLSSQTKGPIIITPHPGEFSKLTGISVKEIQANRIKLAKKFATENNIMVVLKGHYTIIAYPDGVMFINPTGNSGLAKGGSGDVLTGMLVSMLATHSNYSAAVRNAVYIHGLCAELWSETHAETSMVSSDFNELLPVVLKQIEYE